MQEKMKKIIELLKQRNESLATMESCTGGGLANLITNISGASEVFAFGAVTYSNEFKVKMGVSQKTIDTYTVYSIKTAQDMAKAISIFASATYGIGITGQLRTNDPKNKQIQNNIVYFAIYNQVLDSYELGELQVTKETREENKNQILKQILEKFEYILGGNL